MKKTVEEWTKEFATNVNKQDQWIAYDLDDDRLDHPEVISPEKLLRKLESIGASYDIPGEYIYYRKHDKERGFYDCVCGPIVVLYDNKYATTIDYEDGCICMGKDFYDAVNYMHISDCPYSGKECYDDLVFEILDNRFDFACSGMEFQYMWSWVIMPDKEASKLVQEI